MNFQEQLTQTNQPRIPYSFWILIINLALIAGGFVVSAVLASLHFSPKYAVLVTGPMIIGFTLLSSGVYAGWKYSSVDSRRLRLNKIGLWGNSILYIILILGLVGSLGYRSLAW